MKWAVKFRSDSIERYPPELYPGVPDVGGGPLWVGVSEGVGVSVGMNLIFVKSHESLRQISLSFASKAVTCQPYCPPLGMDSK